MSPTLLAPVPIEPTPTPWQFPDPEEAGSEDLVAIGADLSPGTVLAAYRAGMFPMPVEAGGPIGWWSPQPRAILPIDQFRPSRSLRKSQRRFRTTVNQAFRHVIAACADPSRPHGWISRDVIDAYQRLHELGWAHSIETWTPGGELVGGLYGIAIGGFFAGESMFHRTTDASKVALVRLIDELRRGGASLLDVQWATDHLRSLGAIEIPRAEYLQRLEAALQLRLPAVFAAGPGT